MKNFVSRVSATGTALVLTAGTALAQGAPATPTDVGGLADQFDPSKMVSAVLGMGAKGLLIIIAVVGVTIVFSMLKKSK